METFLKNYFTRNYEINFAFLSNESMHEPKLKIILVLMIVMIENKILINKIKQIMHRLFYLNKLVFWVKFYWIVSVPIFE